MPGAHSYGSLAPVTTRPVLWIARHGATEWSRNGRHTSRTDLPLLPDGVQEAVELGERLRGEQFSLVLTSPRQRARETARLAGFPDAVVIEAAREWEYGDYEGITTPQIRELVPGWSIWTHGAQHGESPGDVGMRADEVLSRVRESGAEQALLFAHGHFLRVLTARWLGQPPAQGMHYRLDTSTLSTLGWEREVAVLLRWNA